MKIKKYTRVTAFFLAVCTVLLMLPLSVRADEYWPDGVKTQSKSAIVMEVNTGTVLYEKKSHEKHYPASITKIMTVLLAIENCDMDEVVTFSADAVFKNEGDTSHIARNLGEKLTMEQCLYAVMLESANECAYAVAEHVGPWQIPPAEIFCCDNNPGISIKAAQYSTIFAVPSARSEEWWPGYCVLTVPSLPPAFQSPRRTAEWFHDFSAIPGKKRSVCPDPASCVWIHYPSAFAAVT